MSSVLSVIFSFSVNANPVLASGKSICSISRKNKAIQGRTMSDFKVPISLITYCKKMPSSFVLRIFFFFISILLIVCPTSLYAVEIDSSLENSLPVKIEETSGEMTQKQMNDLFGEDPYLGQTSYLQSPDCFSQRDKSK